MSQTLVPDTAATEALAGRLFEAGLAAAEVLTVYIGDVLGLYRSLDRDGPATADELAARTGTAPRYAREWLEQQAVCGICQVDDADAPPDRRRFSLPAAHAAALTDPDSPFSIAPLPRFIGAIGAVLPRLLDAYRTGGGVAWDAFGPDAIAAQGDFNRPWLVSSFGTEMLPSVPDIHAKLSSGTAEVVDVCCGAGWSAIAIAKAYPGVSVDGFDLDESSIAIARRNAAEAGVSDRVRFEVRDCTQAAGGANYDLAVVIEAIHDLSDPVGVLRAIRTSLKPDGVLLVADERVADTFTAPGDETERFMYAASILSCLPAGMADTPSAATGTVMRTSTLERYAREAGFDALDVLDIEHPLLRFYRLS